jgi:ATP-dependent protease HslVU (ClpYQ) peptidase subunit
MTCIVGIETTSGVVMGCDSFTGDHHDSNVMAGPKVFERNGWIVGVAGSSRIANLLEYVFKWPRAPKTDDDGAVVRLALAMVRLLGDDELCCAKDDGEKGLQSTMLVGTGSRLYLLGGDLGVDRSRFGYHAIGGGAAEAQGALAVLPVKMPARDRAFAALRASAKHCSCVRGPFRVFGPKV